MTNLAHVSTRFAITTALQLLGTIRTAVKQLPTTIMPPLKALVQAIEELTTLVSPIRC